MIIDSLMFGSGFEILFFIASFLVLATLIAAAARHIGEKNRNRRAPRLNVDAEVMSKRTHVQLSHVRMHHPAQAFDAAYYATFLMESGDRLELRLPGEAYGALAEGDHGRLTFQGTRYIAFDH